MAVELIPLKFKKLFNQFLNMKSFLKAARLNRQLLLPQNSVVFAEFPRSGGTFISSLLLDVVFDTLEATSIPSANSINQTNLFQYATDYDQLNKSNYTAKKSPSLNFFKTHKCLISYITAYLVIIRHPLKVFKSYYGYSYRVNKKISLKRNMAKFFFNTPCLRRYVDFNDFYLKSQRNQKTFFIRNEDIVKPPYRVINALRNSFCKDLLSETCLESKLACYSYSKWMNNEESWNQNFAFDARRNITKAYEWDPDLALSLLKDSPFYGKIENIASTYNYDLQDELI